METFAPGAAGGSAQPGQRIFHWFGVHHPDGTLSGAGLIVIAGTAGPATEEALRRSEERYRALVQGGAQITWVTSPEGEMLEDSAEWRWITGQTVDEFLGNGWLESIHPEDRERVERDWRESLRTGRLSKSGSGCGPGAAGTGTTTCGRCRSSGTARSPSGSAPAPT